MNQNTNTNTNTSINNEQMFLINILNNMYNDNLRHIENLVVINNDIRHYISNLLNRQNNSFNRNRTRNRGGGGQINLNNIPYIIDYVQEYTVPLSSQTNWTQTADIPRNPLRNRNSTQTTSRLSRLFQNFLDPVEVYPTLPQIEAATRQVRYCDVVTPVNRSCPISLEPFNDNEMVSIIRFCGHIFHTEELNRWFRSNCRCPVCRYDIRNYNTSSSLSNLINNEQTSVDPSNNEIPPVSSSINNSSSHETERNENGNSNLENLVSTFVNSDLLDTGTQQIINNFLDLSNNTNTDPYIILDFFTSLQRRNP